MSYVSTTATGTGEEATPPERGRPASAVRKLSLRPPPRSARHNKRRKWSRLSWGVGALVVTGAVIGWIVGADTIEEGPAVPEPYAGTWSGQMRQENRAGEHVADWEAGITLDAGATGGTAHWYSFDCRGELTVTEVTSGHAMFDYTEAYDPESRCIDEATLTLARGQSAGELTAEWTAVTEVGTVMISRGALEE